MVQHSNQMKLPDSPKDIRKFGVIMILFFGVLWGIGLWRQKEIPMYIFGTLSLFGTLFVLMPGPLKPLYRGWLKAAHFIGRIMTAVILTLTYYLAITPTAILKRIFSSRPLPQAPEKEADSYWVARSEPVQGKERFFKRY